MTIDSVDDRPVGAWSPDIKSTLPSQYLPLSTMFQHKNVYTDIDTANELSDFTGLAIQQLIRFRPQRLVVHELLIRISADIFVSDGSKYEDLGVNFRRVANLILVDYIEPRMTQILDRFDQLQRQSEVMVLAKLESELFTLPAKPDAQRKRPSWIARFMKKPVKPKPCVAETLEQRHRHILDQWRQQARTGDDSLSRAVNAALAIIANALIIKHGRIIGDKSLLSGLVTGLVCNQHGSALIGDMIAGYILQAATEQGFRLLPAQQKPVVINVKGASASGKSTMRPLQRLHCERLGFNWQDFALISPDIWRKYLLDYDSLGDAYKYAGTLAGDEIPIIDQKLDRYIAGKAAADTIPHLLIDRFRFDSFAPGQDTEAGSNLLTRFGHTVYLLFMVTPPHCTVERAWLRGLQVGRYKAVDDLLDHNIEAFTGIPKLFFTWALRQDKTVYYEFLDNSVAPKQTPKTIAFGSNGELYIIDFKCMLDVMRYTKININATNPGDVYPSPQAMSAPANVDFLIQCANKIPRIHFVERSSGQIYASMTSGEMEWVDRARLQRNLEDDQTRAALLAMAPRLLQELPQIRAQTAVSVAESILRHTLGEMH